MLTLTLKGRTPPRTPSCGAQPSRWNTGRTVRTRSYASLVGKWFALLALVLAGCAVGDVETPRPRIEANACFSSFANAVEGWDYFVGPVPAKCQHLDESYRIVVTNGPMPCKASDPGRVVGCQMPDERAIYIAADVSETKKVDISVHEWIHALSQCIDGDGDPNHLKLAAWGKHPHDHTVDISPDNARSYGIVTSALGPCLD